MRSIDLDSLDIFRTVATEGGVIRAAQKLNRVSNVTTRIKQLEKQMLEHARNLEFEKAARVRDQLAMLREQAFGAPGGDHVPPAGASA